MHADCILIACRRYIVEWDPSDRAVDNETVTVVETGFTVIGLVSPSLTFSHLPPSLAVSRLLSPFPSFSHLLSPSLALSLR